MNSEQLYYFELAYAEKSFSAAARKVPVSHQGLTKSIRSLERELGVPLFTTDPESGLPSPTPYAHELLEFVAVFNSNLRLLNESFNRIRNEENYTVRLGCSLGVLGAYGPSLIDDFLAVHPNVCVPYWESNDTLCEQGLLENRYDIALCVSPITEGCVGTALYESPVYFWLKRDDPAARRALTGNGFLTAHDLAGRDIAMPGLGSKCRDRFERLAATRNIELGAIHHIDDATALCSFAASGRGLSFTLHHLHANPAFSTGLVTSVPLELVSWSFGIARTRDHQPSAAESAFWDWCVRFCANMPRDPCCNKELMGICTRER